MIDDTTRSSICTLDILVRTEYTHRDSPGIELLGSVKSAGPWLKFGMQNVDRAEAVVPTCRCPVFRRTPSVQSNEAYRTIGTIRPIAFVRFFNKLRL